MDFNSFIQKNKEKKTSYKQKERKENTERKEKHNNKNKKMLIDIHIDQLVTNHNCNDNIMFS